jgi:hypothetical protein
MELLKDILTIVAFIIFAVITTFGSLAAMHERDANRKGMREGKNDYYGNKIEEEDE